MVVHENGAHGGARGNATEKYFFMKGCLALCIWVLGCCVACVGLLAIVLSRENGGPAGCPGRLQLGLGGAIYAGYHECMGIARVPIK